MYKPLYLSLNILMNTSVRGWRWTNLVSQPRLRAIFFSFYTLGEKSNLGPKFVQSFQTFFFFGMETKFFKRRLALRQAGGGRVAVLRWWVDCGIMHTSILYS